VLIVRPDIRGTSWYDLSNFDGSKSTYIYINEKYCDAKQVGEMTQTTLDLVGELVKEGTYTSSAIPFDNDDPQTGKVVNITTAKYRIKKRE